jgi:lipoyl(octanoyl) transferase
MAYGEALELQRAAAKARIDGSLPDDTLLLVEHPPVITLGRSNQGGTLLADREEIARHGVELFEVERGGEATYHGPGQLVGYPIMHLERHKPDLHWYLRKLESVLIAALLRLGLPAVQSPGLTGVWTPGVGRARAEPGSAFLGASGGRSGPAAADLQSPDPATGNQAAGPALSTQYSAGGAGSQPPTQGPRLRKIASIGVHARSWVTWHGFALNVSTDLRPFELMVPCGIDGVQMTTLGRELRREVPMGEVRAEVIRAMAESFDLTAESWPADSRVRSLGAERDGRSSVVR